MLARSKRNDLEGGKSFFQVDFKTIEGYSPLLNRKLQVKSPRGSTSHFKFNNIILLYCGLSIGNKL